MENEAMIYNKLDRFSPSMLIEYLNCPLSFYYRYIAKIKLPQKQIHLVFGSAIHAAIEELFENKDPYEAFNKEYNINKLLDEEKDIYEEYKELGKEMIRNYIKEFPTLDKLYNLSDGQSELYVKRNLINPLSKKETAIPMSGRLDRLTNDGIVVEYKTWLINAVKKGLWPKKASRSSKRTLRS